jgi:hypothetical protein
MYNFEREKEICLCFQLIPIISVYYIFEREKENCTNTLDLAFKIR